MQTKDRKGRLFLATLSGARSKAKNENHRALFLGGLAQVRFVPADDINRHLRQIGTTRKDYGQERELRRDMVGGKKKWFGQNRPTSRLYTQFQTPLQNFGSSRQLGDVASITSVSINLSTS
jgi:hypothetical protein